MKLTYGQIEDLLFDGGLDIENTTLTVVEEGEWSQDHKSQYKNIIFTDGSKFYRGSIGRSGSPFTDWTYDSEVFGSDSLTDTISEVEKQEVVVTKWVDVK